MGCKHSDKGSDAPLIVAVTDAGALWRGRSHGPSETEERKEGTGLSRIQGEQGIFCQLFLYMFLSQFAFSSSLLQTTLWQLPSIFNYSTPLFRIAQGHF